MIKVGDYVIRNSYSGDVLFKVVEIKDDNTAKLKGISYRVMADASLEDIELAGGIRPTPKEKDVMEKLQEIVVKLVKDREEQNKKNPSIQKIGKVLHIDGDSFYLTLCLKYYEALGIPAVGECIAEKLQSKKVAELVKKHNPDILVLTGHDGLNKSATNLDDVREYKNSQYFMDAVIEARKASSTKQPLVIFAGACQSYFEGLLGAGADYAASPKRIFIHALDPVFLVERVAYCPFHEVLSIKQAIENTITQFEGLGGYETMGVARKGGPVSEIKGKDNDAIEVSNMDFDTDILMNQTMYDPAVYMYRKKNTQKSKIEQEQEIRSIYETGKNKTAPLSYEEKVKYAMQSVSNNTDGRVYENTEDDAYENRDYLNKTNNRDYLNERNNRDYLNERNNRDYLNETNNRDYLNERNNRDYLNETNNREYKSEEIKKENKEMGLSERTIANYVGNAMPYMTLKKK
ncbi:MAG: sporulation peptidase YabG [Cellulosilyticaceae bacterium]